MKKSIVLILTNEELIRLDLRAVVACGQKGSSLAAMARLSALPLGRQCPRENTGSLNLSLP